jgi:hypothetical protein
LREQPRKLTPHLPARRHHHHQQAEAAGGLFPRSVSSYVGDKWGCDDGRKWAVGGEVVLCGGGD